MVASLFSLREHFVFGRVCLRFIYIYDFVISFRHYSIFFHIIPFFFSCLVHSVCLVIIFICSAILSLPLLLLLLFLLVSLLSVEEAVIARKKIDVISLLLPRFYDHSF